MKYLLLFLPALLFAENQNTNDIRSVHVAGPVPVAYSASNVNSHVMSGLLQYGNFQHLKIVCASGACDASCDVGVNTKYDAGAPPDSLGDDIFRASMKGVIDDNVHIGNSVYMHSITGAPVTCSFDIVVW